MAGAIFKVIIREGDQEEPKVEVAVPLQLAKWALKLLPIVENKIQAETELNIEALGDLLNEGFDELEEIADFDLVKINDGNASIKISIENE